MDSYNHLNVVMLVGTTKLCTFLYQTCQFLASWQVPSKIVQILGSCDQ